MSLQDFLKSKVDDHEHAVLKDKSTVITRAHFWKIHHDSKKEDINLKLGRYKKIKQGAIEKEIPEIEDPKSELTLDHEEFLSLIRFLSEKYEPFKLGLKKYISLNESFSEEGVEALRAIFQNEDRAKVLSLVMKNNLLPADLISGIAFVNKKRAIREFENMLSANPVEPVWQGWFKKNDWVLGSDFVKILGEREIDTENITDYLMQAYDGFLDIVEIKRPSSDLKFWAEAKDHNNYYPSTELIKAITQASNYIHEVELEANSDKFIQRVGARAIKPRCVLIYGRSNDWNDEHKKAYRIFNRSYHNLTVLTYDHVLNRARKILE